MEKIVIIGAGQASAWAAHTLRKNNFEGTISIVSDENHIFYERPPLSKQVLLGEMTTEQLSFFPEDVIESLDITWYKPETAVSIDRAAQTVELSSGKSLPYDKLLIATGSRSRLPVKAWADMKNVLTLRTAADAEKLSESLSSVKKAIIIGAGWIGLEVAATARKKEIDVSIYERGPRVCTRSLGAEVSQYIQQFHEDNGVTFHFSFGDYTLEPQADGRVAICQNNEVVDIADLVVVAIGAEIAKELADHAGLTTKDGIVVDQQGRTSDANIYAAGDVAIHPVLGFCIQSWANAQNQAICAAKAMLGTDDTYQDVPWIWSDQYNFNIQILGTLANHQDLELIVRDYGDGKISYLYLDQDAKLVHAVAVNDSKLIKMAKRWMKAELSLDKMLLKDTSIDVIKIKA